MLEIHGTELTHGVLINWPLAFSLRPLFVLHFIVSYVLLFIMYVIYTYVYICVHTHIHTLITTDY